jgi:hypothetical protein
LAALIAEFTAVVTLMASELEPVAASSSELMSIPSDEDDELVPSNEAKSDDDRPTELIANPP